MDLRELGQWDGLEERSVTIIRVCSHGGVNVDETGWETDSTCTGKIVNVLVSVTVDILEKSLQSTNIGVWKFVCSSSDGSKSGN